MYLDAENLGYSSLEIMLPHLSDIIHMEYQGNSKSVVARFLKPLKTTVIFKQGDYNGCP